MKIRNMVGLALIGSALYAHKKHGGDWTLDSFKQSLRDLWDGLEQNARRVSETAQETLERAREQINEAVPTTESYAGR